MQSSIESLAEAMRRHTRSSRRNLWHYTTGENLRGILETGAILPTSTPSSDGTRPEVPAVWFTYSDDWDPGVGGGMQLTPDEATRAASAFLRGGVEAMRKTQPRLTMSAVGGLARISVSPDVAPLTWREFVARGLFDPRVAREQEKLDRALGADHDEWRASLDPVPASKWLAVEVRSRDEGRDNEWRPLRPRDLSAS